MTLGEAIRKLKAKRAAERERRRIFNEARVMAVEYAEAVMRAWMDIETTKTKESTNGASD